MTERRRYRGVRDVERLQDFTARQIQLHGRTGLMHPGDVPHRIFNTLRRDDPCDTVHIWETSGSGIVAWALLDPRGAGFDLQISPQIREIEPRLEYELVVWSEERLLELMVERRSEATSIETDAFVDDHSRTKVLTGIGWVRHDCGVIVLARRDLQDVPDADLPPGYRLRCVRGVAEAAAVGELHSVGFGSSWSPDQYRRVMESPGYEADREFVVEAANGELAAFCVTWPDEINRVGLFEPVAVHPAHRRQGLGRDVLRNGMKAMRQWGMESAEVMYEVDNPGAEPLYCGEGFTPVAQVAIYRKPISLGS